VIERKKDKQVSKRGMGHKINNLGEVLAWSLE